MVGPVPGISAQRLPMNVPRIIGQNERLRSAFDGNMSEIPTLAYFMSTVSVLLMLFMNSAMPNIPRASAMIALQRRAVRQRRAGKQSHQHQRTDFGRTEFKRHLDEERRQENHLGDAEGRS